MNLGLDGANLLPEFENLRLNDLSPDMAATSRSDLQLVAALGDEELFKATAKVVVECMDYGGLYPSQAPEVLAGDCPSLVATETRPCFKWPSS